MRIKHLRKARANRLPIPSEEIMKLMDILIACEESATVREEFRKRGHNAWSCDILPSGIPGKHIQGDVRNQLNKGWDLMIAFPPCTRLTVTGNRWYKPEFAEKFPNIVKEREEAIEFFMLLANAPVGKIALENPVGIMSTIWRKPDQIIQPFYFGDNQPKKTCLWLKNLPPLIWHKTDTLFEKSEYVEPEYVLYKSKKSGFSKYPKNWSIPPSEDRARIRSKTFPGIARAMAEQWG